MSLITAFKDIKNNAKSATTGLNNTTTPVTFSVTTTQGARFPVVVNGFWVTAWDSSLYPDPGDDPNMEVLLVTARTGDSFTATRAQLGTANIAHAATSVTVALLNEDQIIKDLQNSINVLETQALNNFIFGGM
jgi:hypothetical protein